MSNFIVSQLCKSSKILALVLINLGFTLLLALLLALLCFALPLVLTNGKKSIPIWGFSPIEGLNKNNHNAAKAGSKPCLGPSAKADGKS